MKAKETPNDQSIELIDTYRIHTMNWYQEDTLKFPNKFEMHFHDQSMDLNRANVEKNNVHHLISIE